MSKKKDEFNNKNKFIVYDKPNEKQKFPHFRKYKKSKHPAMITSEYSNFEWNYRKVMHNRKDGRHLNDIYYPNPNPLDSEPMYVAKRVRHDKKDNFSNWKYKWKIKQ